MYFNPRIPRGMRPSSLIFRQCSPIFQSTHPSRDATQSIRQDARTDIISIHASLAGCDSVIFIDKPPHLYFNPRIPRGMRLTKLFGRSPAGIFQSTHPSRDATKDGALVRYGVTEFQSTHPSRDATRAAKPCVSMMSISIHASLAGCDGYQLPRQSHNSYFNPRIPRGMRPVKDITSKAASGFQSTHPSRKRQTQDTLKVGHSSSL